MVRNVTGDRESCEDIAQDVFLAAYRKLSSFDPACSKFSTWLFTIARNKSINASRKKRPRSMSELPESANRHNPVEELAGELNIPCTVGRWKNPKALKKGSIEDAARRRRFQFFNGLAKRINAQAVVLAHTEDDLAETVLMRILRGTGLHGLRGILPRRELDGIYFVRPLLNSKKNDVLAFLKKKRIQFRVDPTNKQAKFFRNKIRLELLPLLKKRYNQNIHEILTNLANNTGTDYDYLESQAQKLFAKYAKCPANNKNIRIHLKSFAVQHPALKRMIIRVGIEKLKGNINRLNLVHFLEIEDLLQNRPKGAIVHLPQNICIRKDSQHLALFHS